MRPAFRRDLPPWEQPQPAPAKPAPLRVRRRYSFALVASLAALGLTQAATAAASDLSQASPAAQSSAVAHAVPTALPTTTTTAPPATVPPATVPPTTAPPATTPPAPRKVVVAAAPTPSPSGYGCGPALAYLAAHSAPGFRFECPGYSLGHQAMTCINVPGVCAGEKLIVITVPCRAAYMNEASNSYSVQGLSNAPIDPYGYCH